MTKLQAVALATSSAIIFTSPPDCEARGTSKHFSGNCSYYGRKFHGKKTASGEKFNMYKMTAAHKTLPFGTKLMVENPKNGKAVIVKVNDRGPYSKKRVLDLSREAARRIGILTGGHAFLECTVIPK